MIITEILEDKFKHNYSDSGFYIKSPTGALYSDAIDDIDSNIKYTETDIIIEIEEVEEK